MKTTCSTADLSDASAGHSHSCETQFRQYGARRAFCGRIRTVQCYADNVVVLGLLGTPSDGGVLVVDGGGYLGCALLGDRVAELGRKNGWAGIVILGAVRDTAALAQLDLGIKALGSNPQKSGKRGTGLTDVEVTFGGVKFVPGHWLYSDDDGILVAPSPLGE